MNSEQNYSKPEMSELEIIGEGILCASDTKTGLLNEDWKWNDDYSIF